LAISSRSIFTTGSEKMGGGIDFSQEKHIRTNPAVAKHFEDDNIPNDEVTYSESDKKI
jgi:hypothetical protein